MANISFRLPQDIEDDELRTWLERAMSEGKPGPEFQSIRAHAPGVMRSFTMSREWVYHSGHLDFELKELLRAYIALSGDCTYCAGQGVARAIRDDDTQLNDLLQFERSDMYSDREKLALRYADAIMWDPSLADAAMWADLRNEFTEPELVELGYWVGFTFGGQRWLRTLASSQGQLQQAVDAAQAASANVVDAATVVAGHNETSD